MDITVIGRKALDFFSTYHDFSDSNRNLKFKWVRDKDINIQYETSITECLRIRRGEPSKIHPPVPSVLLSALQQYRDNLSA